MLPKTQITIILFGILFGAPVAAPWMSSGSSASARQPRTAAKTDGEATRRVAEIMTRALARDYTLVDGSTATGQPVKNVTRIMWVPPAKQDYEDIAKLGESAIPALAAYVAPGAKPKGFVQLLAVDFLASIGGASTIAPLGDALDSRNWQVARLCALDTLGQMPEPEAVSLVRSVLGDSDPQLSNRAKRILSAHNE